MVRRIVPLFLAGLLVLGCGKKDREFRSGAIEPSIAGTWSGVVKIDDVPTSVELSLQQQGVGVKGTYTADNVSRTLAASGSVRGATTGPTFSLDITGDPPACLNRLQMGGQNDGSTLTLNVIGTDCDGASLRGESVLRKKTP